METSNKNEMINCMAKIELLTSKIPNLILVLFKHWTTLLLLINDVLNVCQLAPLYDIRV